MFGCLGDYVWHEKIFGLVYLFKSISTPNGLFNAKIWLISKCLVGFVCLTAYQLFMGYLMPKFDQFWIIVFASGPGDLGSILGRVIPKTLEIVPDISLLNT